MKTYNCKCCGGKDIVFESTAKWNYATQRFVYQIDNFYFEVEHRAFCNVCDNWTDFEIEEQYECMKTLPANEHTNVNNLFNHVDNVKAYELGLIVDYEVGEYYIQDENKWMLAKVKYGI